MLTSDKVNFQSKSVTRDNSVHNIEIFNIEYWSIHQFAIHQGLVYLYM